MGIKTVPHRPYTPDVAPYDFWLFPKLRGCRYETIEERKEAVTKVIDPLIQGVFNAAFQMLLEQYNKCIAAGGDYLEGDKSFMCVLSIKVPIRKNSVNLFNDPRIYIYLYIYVWLYIYIYMCVCVCVKYFCLVQREIKVHEEIYIFWVYLFCSYIRVIYVHITSLVLSSEDIYCTRHCYWGTQ